MKLFHRHAWILIDKEVIPSAYEQARSNTETGFTAPPWVFRKSVIFTYRCTVCGKVTHKQFQGP